MFGGRCVGGTVIKVNKADKVLWILRTNLTHTLHSINPLPHPPAPTLLVAVCKYGQI